MTESKRADPRLETISDEIEGRGYALNSARHPIAPDPFIHTVGFSAINHHPELVFYQWNRQAAERACTKMYERVVNGHVFQHGDRVGGLITGYHTIILMVPLDVTVPIASDLYGELDVRALRVFSPDHQGRFPWEKGSEIAHHPHNTNSVPPGGYIRTYDI